MILKSFFIAFLLLLHSVMVTSFLFAKDPLSAIDWLAEKINDPPDFYTNPTENLVVIDNNIEKMNLPNISKNSIGIFPSIRLGLGVDIWKKNNENEIASSLNKISISDLYYLNRLLKRILLIEADPPIIVKDRKFSGVIFLRARIIKLVKMGALDDAEALLLEANPNIDANLIDLWSQISFLTFRFDRFCETILKGYNTLIHPAHKIICLARSGDWNAAALTLATYSSIKEIDGDYEKLLINYLDHEAELEIKDKSLCNKDDPMLKYLCNFSNGSVQNSLFNVKYLHSDLSRGKSIRSRLIASEELVKSGALNPDILFATYNIKQPSTSGGVWARAKLIQDLEKSINSNYQNEVILSNQLNLIFDEFLKNNLLSAFAEFYSKRLNSIDSNYLPLNEIIIAINILSGNYTYEIRDYKISNSKLQNVIDVINERDKIILNLDNQKKFHNHNSIIYVNEKYSQLQRAILKASNGNYPNGTISNQGFKKTLSKRQDGLILLNSIDLISSSFNSDIIDLQTGLASLVNLGLINDFKSISNELLIMEFLKKL